MFDFKIYKLKESKIKKNIIQIINDLVMKNFKKEFYFETKYKYTEDLRLINSKCPIFDYSNLFVDILFENNIIQNIFQTFNKNIYLNHIQFRIVYKNNESYAHWHRDTIYKNEKYDGPVPQSFKLMYYPRLFSRDNCLSLLEKSNVSYDFENKNLDCNELKKPFESYKKKNIKIIKNTNDDMLFFDTTTYHQAEMPSSNILQPRIIYIFSVNEEKVLKNLDNNNLLKYYISKCIKHNLIKNLDFNDLSIE